MSGLERVHARRASMPLRRVSRGSLLRGAGAVVITAVVSIAAACSDEDTVDTIPPPWPSSTSSTSSTRGLDEGPQVPTQPTTRTTRPTTSTSSVVAPHAGSGPLVSPRP
jgi:hypothetical protein